MATLPPVSLEPDGTVARVCARYLDLADRYAPGLVEGLYLQGSVALGDYVDSVSDIDFVAVSSSPALSSPIQAVHAQLRRYHPKPFFDGIYVSWDDLRADPATVPAGISVHEWRVEPHARSERTPVTWEILAQAGIAVRGPAAGELGVHTDWPGLAAATRRNLDEYWAPWVERAARTPVGLTAWATSWGVLGVARLRHTLAAGRITTKTEAAGFAADRYDPRWHRIVAEALRIRRGGRPLYRNPWRRRADLAGFAREVLSS